MNLVVSGRQLGYCVRHLLSPDLFVPRVMAVGIVGSLLTHDSTCHLDLTGEDDDPMIRGHTFRRDLLVCMELSELGLLDHLAETTFNEGSHTEDAVSDCFEGLVLLEPSDPESSFKVV